MPRPIGKGDPKVREATRRYRERLSARKVPEVDQVYAAIAAAFVSFAWDAKQRAKTSKNHEILRRLYRETMAVLEAQGYDTEACDKVLLRNLKQKRFYDVLDYGREAKSRITKRSV